MYLLLPSGEETGRVALVLPTEKKLRQRQIQTFEWNSEQLLKSRLPRLHQSLLQIAEKALTSIPLVEAVFYDTVQTAEELARRLATITREIEAVVPDVYNAEVSNEGYLHRLFDSFKKDLLPTLKLRSTNARNYSFADIYAQTIAYGLFTARVFSYKKHKDDLTTTEFNRSTAWELLPKTNPFLRQLFQDLSKQWPEDLGDKLIEKIAEIISILRVAKMEVILRDFHQKINQEDIVIRFYEDFLAAYHPQMREQRGVYYTPQPVVSYIVRSVDHILKQDFGLRDGLADATKVQRKSPDGKGTTETHKVLINDPAVGTATFLYEVINHIHKSFQSQPEKWSDYVSQDLLPRLIGFELLMAPYAVAHMKLGLQLAELGYQFDPEERLRIFLTNTLQEAFQIPPPEDYFSKLIYDEADDANRVKETAPVMVILGNPPYSGHSANNGEWIRNLLRGRDISTDQQTSNYFEVDGEPLGKKNPRWLNDDYVKFIRFSQWRIERTGYGVLAFVTNHGYLDNTTFRGMRQSLMKAFDDIYVLNLHGNSKKKEKCPDGSKDENVFDIQQGVAINIFVKHPNEEKEIATVHHADLWTDRECKYNWLKEKDLSTTQWAKLKPQHPCYLFVPRDRDLLSEYQKGWKITDIFPVNSVGIVTARDKFTIHWSQEEAWNTVSEFAKLPPEQARTKYNLSKDAQDWKVELAQKDLKKHPDIETKELGPFKELLAPILYRPFDICYTYYTGKPKGFHCRPRCEIMQHMLTGENYALHVCKQIVSGNWHHILVTNQITENCYVSNKTRECGYTLPLYIYLTTIAGKTIKCPNFSDFFCQN